MVVPISIFLVFFPDPDDIYNFGIWTNIEYTFRLFFFVFLIVILAAAATSIFKKYKINYVYIFDINIRKNVTPLQLLRLSIMMIFVWSVCFFMQVTVFDWYWLFPKNNKVPTIFVASLFLLAIMFNILPWFHRPMRW